MLRSVPRWIGVGLIVVLIAGTAAAIVMVTSGAKTANRLGHPSLISERPAIARKPIVKCLRSGHRICGPKVSQYRLNRPDNGTTTMLSQFQVLDELGWQNDSSGAQLMAYARAETAFPSLAAETSTVVDPARQVWVVTVSFSSPITVPYALGYGPPGAVDTTTASSESAVVDAQTGLITDYCEGCAVIVTSG